MSASLTPRVNAMSDNFMVLALLVITIAFFVNSFKKVTVINQ